MSTDTDVIEREEVKLKKPGKWCVVLHNDDVTPMDFVVELLHYVFKMELQQATELMVKVHTDGQGVAGTFTYEVGEQKLAECNTLIQVNNQSLKVTLERE